MTGTRKLAAAVAAVAALVITPGTASAGPDAAAKLAQTYAPVIAIQPQHRPCGSGEAYRPTVVNLVLGNSEVVLRSAEGQVVTRAPTARDLANAPATDYIDLPGNPLRPGCFYEKQFQSWYGNRKPSVYAHVTTDPEHPGKLVVQYWFYYTFNDFSDKHESDWEMAQLDFNTDSPAQALKAGPYEVDLAQHAGGERAAWNSRILDKQGTHPIVYVATGSHAAYFQRKLYLGKGGTAIFGCDDTRYATTRLRPATILMPDTPVPAGSPFAWLDFKGRWGQKEAGINNGPYGPATDRQAWDNPISWSEGLRTSSVTVPGGRFLGVSATSFFCSGTARAADVINWATLHPVPFLALVIVLVAALLTAIKRTSWRPDDPQPIRRARSTGQMLGSARRLYRQNALMFIAIGLIFVPLSVIAGGVQWVLFHLTGLDNWIALDGDGGPGSALLALLIGGVAALLAAAAVTAAVAAALAGLADGQEVTAIGAYVRAWHHVRSLSRATLVELVALLVLALTVVGIPFAIWLFIRTSLFAQMCVLEERSATGSIVASARLTRGRWWRTFAFTVFVDVLAIVSGPILGVLILLASSQSLTVINLVSSLVYALTMPYAAIALTLYCFDLQARAIPPPHARASAA